MKRNVNARDGESLTRTTDLQADKGDFLHVQKGCFQI